MRRLDDATAQITFLAMAADLERVWELRSRESEQFEFALWKMYFSWWPVFFDEDWPYPHRLRPDLFDEDFGFIGRENDLSNAAGMFGECFGHVFIQAARRTCSADQLIDAFIAYIRIPTHEELGRYSTCLPMVEEFIGHHPDREAEILEWVRSNTTNEYILPYSVLKNDRSLSGWRSTETFRSSCFAEEMARRAERSIEKATEQLPHCVARGDIEAVKSMLAKGADVAAVVAEHGPLLNLAEANGRVKMAEFLQNENLHPTPLIKYGNQ